MLLCISIPGPDLASVRQQMAQAESLASMVELRIDLFDAIPLADLIAIKRHYSLPVLVTLRSEKQGGRFDGDEAARALYLKHLCALQPELLDIELGTPRSEVLELKQLLRHTHFVISYHDIMGMPPDLTEVLHAMQQLPAHHYKIAVTALSTNDSLRMLEFTRDVNRRAGNLSGICMGPFGQITRILAPIVGCPMTFACLDEDSSAAPGQIPASQLKELYDIHRLEETSQMVGLIGDPVDLSKGYLVHNAVFREVGLPAVYVKMRVRPDELALFVERAKRLKWRGFSVTMPLKEAIIPFLDAIDPAAQAAGAVNTVVLEEHGFVGYNFDGIGALNAIEAKLSGSVRGMRLVLLGAGGAAKAIAYEAKNRGAEVTIVNRSTERAEILASRLGLHTKPFERLSDLLQSAPDVLVQSTSVGMQPDSNETLVNADDLQPQTLVMDVITSPVVTRLLREAQQRGCQTVTGVDMWIEQAEGQILQWFGKTLSQDQVKKTVCAASHVYHV